MSLCVVCMKEDALAQKACSTCMASAKEKMKERVKVGDAVSKFTRALGIPECGGCKARKHAMNQVVVEGRPAAAVVADLVKAAFNPESNDGS